MTIVDGGCQTTRPKPTRPTQLGQTFFSVFFWPVPGMDSKKLFKTIHFLAFHTPFIFLSWTKRNIFINFDRKSLKQSIHLNTLISPISHSFGNLIVDRVRINEFGRWFFMAFNSFHRDDPFSHGFLFRLMVYDDCLCPIFTESNLVE